jgi:hypothetical protein
MFYESPVGRLTVLLEKNIIRGIKVNFSSKYENRKVKKKIRNNEITST